MLNALMALGNPNDPHHAPGLMFENVAVKHPVPRIIGDERNFDPFSGGDHDGVLPFAVPGWLAISGQDPEDVTMQVHRVPPHCLIVHLDDV